MRICFPGICVSLLLLASAASAWTEPADEAYTSKQLTSFLATAKEWVAAMNAAGKTVDGSPANFNSLAVYVRTNDKFKDSLAKHGLEEAEFYWLGSRTWEAWSVLTVDQMLGQMDADLAAQTKKDSDLLALDREGLTVYQQALAAGRKVMTPEEREAAVKQAQNDQQAAAEQVNQRAEVARAAGVDLAKSEADATAADAAAGSAPADLSDDDKAAFITAKQAEAQAARDSAQEDRMKISDAKEAMAAAQTASDAAIARARQPEVPQTDEDRAAAKQQDQQMITQLQTEISTTQDALKQLADADAAGRNALARQRTKVPQTNVALLKAHAKEFADIWQIKPPDGDGR